MNCIVVSKWRHPIRLLTLINAGTLDGYPRVVLVIVIEVYVYVCLCISGIFCLESGVGSYILITVQMPHISFISQCC